MEQEDGTKGPVRYTTSFTPLHNPARHDTVQTMLTDYIADEIPEWYEELHRVATKIEERAGKKKRMEQIIDEIERNRNKLNKKYSKLYEAQHTQRNKNYIGTYQALMEKKYLNKGGNINETKANARINSYNDTDGKKKETAPSTKKTQIKYTQSGLQGGSNTDIRNVMYVRRTALIKITDSWAVHNVYIGHTTNATVDN